jgi:hypothetical protein
MSRPETELDGFGGSGLTRIARKKFGRCRRRQGTRITHAGHRFTMQCCSSLKPDYFIAVGQWYMDDMDFSQTSNDKARRLLAEAGINSFAQQENRRTSCQLQKARIALEPLAGTPGNASRPPGSLRRKARACNAL